jgi:hypothetical protein
VSLRETYGRSFECPTHEELGGALLLLWSSLLTVTPVVGGLDMPPGLTCNQGRCVDVSESLYKSTTTS